MPATLPAIRCPLLIGRDDLLELADRRLDDVVAGRGQFLLIAGEAGIGKTRLLGAIRRKAQARGLSAVEGSLAPQDRNVPAASILDMARTMARLESFADLGRSLLELADATVAAEHVRRRRLVVDMVDLILASLPGPTILSFEDLQWADDLSLEVIAEIARHSRERALLLTGDYRIEDVPPGASLRGWRARLITQRVAEEVRLSPLTESETALVTTLILNTGLPAPRTVAAAVYERTDGIPLHIEELLGALSADTRVDDAAIREATVPETIDDAVIARMAHRSPEARAVARAGAVIGRCFVPEVLAGIMDVPPDALEAPLQELVDHLVLDPPGVRGVYDFRHQLLRDALYRTIPASERRRFHARAGEFGAQLEGASEVHASVHYERAGLHREAFEAAATGAREASNLSAHREAYELYRRAVANAPDDLDPGERGTLLAAYAAEAAAIEENDIAERANREAREAFLAAGRQAKAAEMLIWVLNIWRREARSLEQRAELLARLRNDLESLPADAEQSHAWADLIGEATRSHLEALELDAARASAKHLSAIARDQPDTARPFEAGTYVGILDILDGRIESGLDSIAMIAANARAAGFEDAGLAAYRDAATYAARSMDYPRARRFIADGMEYADAVEQSHCRHVMGATSALVDWAGGDWDGAISVGRQNIADDGCRRAMAIARGAVGFVLVGRAQIEPARTELLAALAVGEENGAAETILPALWGLAEAALIADEPTRASALCHDALSRARAVGERYLFAPFVVTGVRAEHASGRPAEAEAWLAACEDHLSANPVVAGPALDHARGLVALAAGSTGVAHGALEAAVVGWDDRGRIWEATWARLDLANCLTRSNRFAEAVALAANARSVASRLDSRPLADRADTLLRTARGHVAVDEPWRPLTAREFAVARLVSEGLTNAEIAHELSIAPKTASSHVEHILAKLGASRRAEIATWATHIERSPAAH